MSIKFSILSFFRCMAASCTHTGTKGSWKIDRKLNWKIMNALPLAHRQRQTNNGKVQRKSCFSLAYTIGHFTFYSIKSLILKYKFGLWPRVSGPDSWFCVSQFLYFGRVKNMMRISWLHEEFIISGKLLEVDTCWWWGQSTILCWFSNQQNNTCERASSIIITKFSLKLIFQHIYGIQIIINCVYYHGGLVECFITHIFRRFFFVFLSVSCAHVCISNLFFGFIQYCWHYHYSDCLWWQSLLIHYYRVDDFVMFYSSSCHQTAADAHHQFVSLTGDHCRSFVLMANWFRLRPMTKHAHDEDDDCRRVVA